MANEKRLVAYDPIAFGEFTQSLKNTLEVYDPYSDGYEDGVERIEDWLEFNYVDAVEVVHGRWEKEHDDLDIDRGWKCSHCNGSVYEMTYEPYQYCPHCGAKMDGGNEDG